MNNLDLVTHYFDLSNKGDLEEIEKILYDNIVYSSENVGVHFGKENVLNMKKNFFGKFESIAWGDLEIIEIKNNIFEIDFVLDAVFLDGEKLNKLGKETVIVKDGRIYFIEVKNK